MTIPVLLVTHIVLPDGTRVRARLPHARDLAGVQELLGRLGLDATELDVRRALLFDPRERLVVCATLWNGMSEAIAAVAAVRTGGDRTDLLLCDEALAPGLGAALCAVLDADAVDVRAA